MILPCLVLQSEFSVELQFLNKLNVNHSNLKKLVCGETEALGLNYHSFFLNFTDFSVLAFVRKI